MKSEDSARSGAARTKKRSKTNGDNGSDSGHGSPLIVGIGASAGGINALREFFENVPADSGAAYVVILHLSPDHESKLAEVLQSSSRIPVKQVSERVKVEPNTVYVVSPAMGLAMLDGHIAVHPQQTLEERRAPIDIFFRTLAESHRECAACVILSGTGADGSMGLKRIKERGGAAFVQNPREAEFGEMPRNSIATDLVDAVLPAGEIPARIASYIKSLGKIEIADEPENRTSEQQKSLREILSQLRVRTGHDFANYKRPTVLRRIERRINVHGLSGIEEYAEYIHNNSEEATALLKDLLISVTNFFRDKESFEKLKTEVLTKIVQDRKATDAIRIWTAGCATGEEAYSIAMLVSEAMTGSVDVPNVQIFATDIDNAALSVAREGFYTINDAADVSPERLKQFFTYERGGYRVRRELREMVLFANHNLIKDPPFAHLDLVTCRNLLIYLNAAAQDRVMETIHFALEPGGYLFIGPSESVDSSGDLYAPVSREHHIFQSRQASPRVAYPLPDPVPTYPDRIKPRFTESSPREEKRILERLSYADLHQRLLENYAPPSVVVNEDYDILHISDNAGRYLQITGGDATLNLLRVLRPELRIEVRSALYQALQQHANVDVRDLRFEFDGEVQSVTIRIRPVLRDDDTARGFFLVVFEETEVTPEAVTTIAADKRDEPLIRRIEQELERTKLQLRASSEQFEIQSEELKASNEELQAMNEELRSSAEELETSKEELQSVNEELITVNQELKVKVEELSQSNNDFRNLINSTDIGTVFLDRSLRVNLFSPRAAGIFRLVQSDVGRPLSDLNSQLDYKDLQKDAEHVLESLQAIEREVRSSDGRTFLMQITPYRTAEDRINGVVLALFDISGRVAAENELRAANAQMTGMLESISDGFYAVDRDWNFTYVNRQAEKMLGKTRSELIGKNIWAEFPRAEGSEIAQRLHDAAESGKPVRLTTLSPTMNRWIDVAAHPSPQGLSVYFRDMSEHKKNIELTRYHASLLSIATDAIVALDADQRITFFNTAAERIYGWPADEAVGQPIESVFRPEGGPEAMADWKTIFEERGELRGEWVHHRRDGTAFWAEGTARSFTDGNNQVAGYIAVLRDVSERKRREENLAFLAEVNNILASE